MTLRSATRALAALLLGHVFAAEAWACPVCDSATADQVRAGLSEDLTPTTLAAVAAPFAVIAGVVSLVHFGPPSCWSRP